jgi:hypothetical protein
MATQWNMGDVIVHVFTDDPSYRAYYTKKYDFHFTTGTLKFGPTEATARCNSRAAVTKAPKFERETSPEDAVCEFICLALSDTVFFTRGSTVTYYVKAMRHRLLQDVPFTHESEIGEYSVPVRPTHRFITDCHSFVLRIIDEFYFIQDLTDNQEHANVIDFLHTNHLFEIHTSMEKALLRKNGRAKASIIGEILLNEVRVARLNKSRFLNVERKGGEKHWLKALITGKLKLFSLAQDDIENIIMFDDQTHELFLSEKENMKVTTTPRPSSTPGSPSASSVDAVPWKKPRLE